MTMMPPHNPDLEGRLRAYYQRHSAPPLDLDHLWAQVAPRLGEQGKNSARWQASVGEHQQVSAPAHPTEPLPNQPRRRVRQVLSVILSLAAVLVIALTFTVLFASHAPGRATHPTPATSLTPAPATPGSGGWIAVPGLTSTAWLPVIAPTDPRVVYRVLPQAGHSPPVQLLRSEDDGATWQELPVPAGTAAILDASLVVSPLSAQGVFLTIATGSATSPTCPSGQATGEASKAVFAGGVVCTVHYFSMDGGRVWTPLPLPFSGALADHAQFLSLGGAYATSNGMLDAQGTRLYAVVGVQSLGARLITSEDGGQTWQSIDAPLLANSQMLCDYRPAPEGATVFAITQPGACNTIGQANLSLWRSDDAGAHWTRVGLLPGPVENGIEVVSRGAAGQPLLYVDAPQASPPRPTDLQVSMDGGQTWQAAPAGGIAAREIPESSLLGTLSDGSVLQAYGAQGSPGTLYAWKPGEAIWRQVAPAVTTQISTLLVNTSGTPARETLWIITEDNGLYSVLYYPRP